MSMSRRSWVLLDALSAEQRGAVNHLVRGASSSCPHRFDTGFVPTANPDRDSIIVTRNSPLISGREQEATWRVSHPERLFHRRRRIN
jgi:hypothetical protein